MGKMISHLTLFVFIFVFGIGLTACCYLFLLSKRSHDSFLRYHLFSLFSLNALLLINVLNLYVITNTDLDQQSGLYIFFYESLCYTGTACKLFWVLFIALASLSLMGEEPTKKVFRITLGTTVLISLAISSFHALIIFQQVRMPEDLPSIILDVFMVLPFTYILLKRKKLKDHLYFTVHMAAFLAALLSRIGTYFQLYTLGVHLMIFYLAALAVYVFTLIWIKKFWTSDSPVSLNSLTAREREIASLVCRGKTNKEISKELYISLQTVKDHIYHIFKKTGVRNRVELAQIVSMKRQMK